MESFVASHTTTSPTDSYLPKNIRSMVENDRLSTLRADFQSLPLQDIMFYNLDDAESAFFKSQTGITDDEQLKKHIVEAQEEAFKVLTNFSINHPSLLTEFWRIIGLSVPMHPSLCIHKVRSPHFCREYPIIDTLQVEDISSFRVRCASRAR